MTEEVEAPPEEQQFPRTITLPPLHFVIGAVAKKDLEPSFCHLEIVNGEAIAYGGRISMKTPIGCSFNVRPHARALMKAVQTCTVEEVINLHMTAGGRLAVTQGKFKAYVDCVPQDTEMPQLRPQGQFFEVNDRFIDAILRLAPFMSIDASRPWAQGLKIGHNSIFVTNNIILAEQFHGSNFPIECIIPADVVHELVRTGEHPVGIQFNEHTLTFYFKNRRWLCTHLVAQDGGWGKAERIFELNTNETGMTILGSEVYEAMDKLKGMLGERGLVYLKGDRICTSPNDEEGASLEVPVANGPIFHAEQLRKLRLLGSGGTGDVRGEIRINLTTWPKPCYFLAPRTRGIIIGVRE